MKKKKVKHCIEKNIGQRGHLMARSIVARSLMASVSLIAVFSFANSALAANKDASVDFELIELISLDRAAPPEVALEEVKLDLSFNGRSDVEEPGFLYFNQQTTVSFAPVSVGVTTVASLGASSSEVLGFDEPKENFTPRFGGTVSEVAALAGLSDEWLTDSFTPRKADAHLGFSFSPLGNEAASKVGVALTSNVKIDGVDAPGVINNPSLLSALERQTYRFGLEVGYSGFNIGASLRSDRSVYADTTSGYGVGFSYTGNSWSTSLNVGEYSRKYKNLFGNFGQDQLNFYSFELGASYNLSNSLKLSGGFRYLAFGEDANLMYLERPQTQAFYLGTDFSF